jgi:hypothetical protein
MMTPDDWQADDAARIEEARRGLARDHYDLMTWGSEQPIGRLPGPPPGAGEILLGPPGTDPARVLAGFTAVGYTTVDGLHSDAVAFAADTHATATADGEFPLPPYDAGGILPHATEPITNRTGLPLLVGAVPGDARFAVKTGAGEDSLLMLDLHAIEVRRTRRGYELLLSSEGRAAYTSRVARERAAAAASRWATRDRIRARRRREHRTRKAQRRDR